MAALDDSFLKTDATDPQDERAIIELLRFLEMRIQRRDLLQEDVSEKQNNFRNMLVKLEHENTCLRHDNNKQKKIIFTLEGRICKLQNHIDSLLYKLNNACDAMRNIQQELRDRDRQLQQHTLDKQKLIQRCNIMIQTEINRMTKEMQIKLQEQHEQLTSCIKKKDNKLKLVKQILTSAREDTCGNIILMPPIASRIETTKKTTSIVPKKELSLMMPINLQTSRSPCGQMRQTLFSRTISNDTHEKTTEEPNPSLSKEKSSTMTFMDSQNSSSHDRIHQIPCHIRTDSNNVQRKTTKETILMTVAESSMFSDSKTKIIDESNSMTSIDSSSSAIASTNTTIITKINFNKKDKIPVVNPRYQRMQNANRWINRPIRIIPTGTILQSRTQPHNQTIRKSTNPKDFMTKSSRYCLLSQEQDVNGELEIYKANVLPTCGGGAQIVFNDTECLKQISPTIAKRNGQKIGK